MHEKSEKVVIIPGGTGYIGAAVAKKLAARDVHIVIPSRKTKEGARGIFTEKNIEVVTCNYDEEKNVAKLVSDIAQKRKVLALIYCAGSFHGHKRVHEFSEADIREKLQSNVISFLNFLRYCVPEMVSRKEGKVVAFGSLAMFEQKPYLGLSTMAKSALESIIKTLSHEQSANGINVNMISPCVVETPKERSIYPSDSGRYWIPCEALAEMVDVLCFEPAGKYVHGQNIPVYNPDPAVLKAREENLRSRGVAVSAVG